ncbi:MAG: M20 metallopeptidase family protein [Sulfobacillus sp.]
MSWQDEVVAHRRALHQIPELGFEESETQAYLHQALQSMGLDPVAHKTGLWADIEGNGPGKTVMLRADIDGLPLKEDTGLSFSSRHEGIMHACGHDGHMAILLGTTARLLANRDDFTGRVRVAFQPAEEKPPGGAVDLIAAGVLEGVDEVLGLHLWSEFPVGEVQLLAGPAMANADEFIIRVKGRGGHGSAPETTKDAVLIAAQIVVNLQTIVSRRIGAFDPAVVSCGTISGGANFNIIAEQAEITGTVRTFSQEVQKRIRQEIHHIAQTTAQLYDAEVDFSYVMGYPAVVNHAQTVARWSKALGGVVELREGQPSMGGEDFAYYLHHRPGALLFLGCAPQGEIFPHHSPHFLINEEALPLGVEALWRGVQSVSE